MFRVIPVLDLLAGQVVHARRGDRATYRAVKSVLCNNAQPLAIVEALRRLHAFDTFYVADLDAIQKRGNHHDMIGQLARANPDMKFWVDGGYATPEDFSLPMNCEPVVGAESLTHPSQAARIGEVTERWILSMDFRGDEFLGPAALLDDARLWPAQILAMNLARVGSAQGPDVDLIRRLATAKPDASIYASGGIRGLADFVAARRSGAGGALVATALHDGTIDSDTLRALGK